MSAPVTAPARLAAAVEAALARPARGVARVEVPAPGVDPAAWVAAQPAGDRRYWHARDESGALAAFGVADAVEADALHDLRDVLGPRLAALPPGARWYGAARFDPAGDVAPGWEAFGRARFVLPRFELRASGSAVVLACHVTDADRADPARLLSDLARLADAPVASGDGLPGPASPALTSGVLSRTDTPDRAAWGAAVTSALDAFRAGVLDKVVLARRSAFRLDGAPAVAGVPGLLRAAAPDSFHVVVEAGASAFVSATPERLFRLTDGRVETEAVAGTRPRDRADELLTSEKDRHEHALVVADLRERLAPLAAALDVDAEPRMLALRRRVHLRTRVAAAVRPDADALDVLAALHPTPAVGGTPREAARAFIAAQEGFDRGLYAGPVGWVGRDDAGRPAAEFAVGIRSALLAPGGVSLFAGAGIVPGSAAAAEWAEVEGKMSDLALALGLS